ncbi:hypothetical protein GCM10010401_13980 [Rarobacter faecitabidus]|uniref:Helix-turn-helix protein n=1 Tax=Rarobacter faecitabidus TaxID=13243 RepID=A0A542ZDY9_RARFA|nr:helix-turn-helix protein [Rarobacter faecitabidus]
MSAGLVVVPAAAEFLTVAEAAAVARCHTVTMRRRVESGEVHATQRVKGGRWTIARVCLEEQLLSGACSHQRPRRSGNVVDLAARRRAGGGR